VNSDHSSVGCVPGDTPHLTLAVPSAARAGNPIKVPEFFATRGGAPGGIGDGVIGRGDA
jgi:hypothetical protein